LHVETLLDYLVSTASQSMLPVSLSPSNLGMHCMHKNECTSVRII